MLTKNQVENSITFTDLESRLRLTALELYAKLEKTEAEFKSLDEVHTAGELDYQDRIASLEADLAELREALERSNYRRYLLSLLLNQ